MSYDKPDYYYAGINTHLLSLLPSTAIRVLEIGCGEGRLGGSIRRNDPIVEVFGVEIDPIAAEAARSNLTDVFVMDVEREDPPLEPGSVDVILYGDVLEHLHDPEAVLVRHKKLLTPGGKVLCCVPNVQHHSVVRHLLRGDWQYRNLGLLDHTHLRFFTAASFIKLLLDAGYMPRLHHAITPASVENEFMAAAAPLLHYLHINEARSRAGLSAFQYLFEGDLDAFASPSEPGPPITFVCCVNDRDLLEENLLSSPCLRSQSRHEVLLYEGCATAAEGLNRGIEAARNDLIVLVHQDVYLPRGWDDTFAQQAATRPDFGVLGVFGVPAGTDHNSARGCVVDRESLLYAVYDWLPQPVSALDELLLAVRKGTPLRIDPTLGWHLYGTDLCLQAADLNLGAFAVRAMCLHNSLQGGGPPLEYWDACHALGTKWKHRLPIHTISTNITEE